MYSRDYCTPAMGASLKDPLLGQNGRPDEEEKFADIDGSYLEKGLPIKETDPEVLLEGKAVAIETHGKSSFWQTTTNCVNILLGIGLLALPTSLEEGGWLSLLIPLAFSIICWYTGVLLARCMGASSSMKIYQDIGEVAYGSRGRMLVTSFLSLEMTAFMVGNTIAMGDNLARIFPHAKLNIPWLDITLEPSQVLGTIAMMVALPTTWLRDISSLSFVSVGGVVTSLVVMATVAWSGVCGGVGFLHSPPLLNVSKLPIVSGVYAYCYTGHVLLPSIYSGMKNPAQFPQALMVAFIIASFIYGGTAILGATMFGEDTQSQITLNIPRNLTVASIALWTTVLTSLSKYGLGIAPVAQQIEALLPFPSHSRTHLALGTIIRTLLMFAVLAIAVTVPFFQNAVALSGAMISLTMAVTFPVAFYLKIFRASLSFTQIVCGLFCVIWAMFFAVICTNASLKAVIEKLNS